jgi:hypothetical protein
MTCRFAGLDPEAEFKPNPRLLRTHLAGCDSSACEGCQPCPERHCEATGCPGRHTDERICPTCVGHVRANLTGIVNMAERLLTEAVHRGVNSEAAMLDAAAANPDAWRQRRRYGYRDHPDDRLGDTQPLWLLRQWHLVICEHLGHGHSLVPSVASAAGYIGGQLTDLARDPEFDIIALANEIRAAHQHLEDVLSEGDRDEISTDVTCLVCQSRLRQRMTSKGIADNWYCNGCHRELATGEYKLAYFDAVQRSALADHLPGVFGDES